MTCQEESCSNSKVVLPVAIEDHIKGDLLQPWANHVNAGIYVCCLRGRHTACTSCGAPSQLPLWHRELPATICIHWGLLTLLQMTQIYIDTQRLLRAA